MVQPCVPPEQYELEPKIIKVRAKKAKAMTHRKIDSGTCWEELAIHITGCLEYGRESGPYCRQPLTWVEHNTVTTRFGNRAGCSAPSGLYALFCIIDPGRCPGLYCCCPFGASEGNRHHKSKGRSASQAPTGRSHSSRGAFQAPRARSHSSRGAFQAPTGRSQYSPGAFQAPTGRSHPSRGAFQAPTGRTQYSPGQRPGLGWQHRKQALKGRNGSSHRIARKMTIGFSWWHRPLACEFEITGWKPMPYYLRTTLNGATA